MATFIELKSKLDTLNQTAVRNRKLDFKILTQNELNQKLLKGTKYENKQLVLTQIGYLRINLFQEYYERIQAAQANQDLDKAVQLMNQYTQIAIPFIQERIHPSILTRIANIFSTSTLPNAAQTLREWQTHHETWKKQKKIKTENNRKATEEFDHIKNLFITLYTLSFSPRNFPPVAVEPSH
jgi:UTP:GlnB (protein PII) uridylyltransferase